MNSISQTDQILHIQEVIYLHTMQSLALESTRSGLQKSLAKGSQWILGSKPHIHIAFEAQQSDANIH